MRTVAAWILAAVLAFFSIAAGAAKLGGDPAMLDLFDDIGAGQWLRYLVGVCEVAGGLGLLVPRLRAGDVPLGRLRAAAAAGLAVLFACATVVNLAVIDESPLLTVVLAALAVAVLVLRRADLPDRGPVIV